MKDFEIKEGGTHCHVFNNAESFGELLNAISAWWIPKESVEGTCLESIQFELDDEGFNCQVFWASLPPGVDIVKEIASQVAKEKANPFGLPELE